MKKTKMLPSFLMLIMCIAVLAVGIYASSPASNGVTGSITVISSAGEVTVKVYKDNVAEKNLLKEGTSRTGVTLPIGELSLDTSNVDSASLAPTVKLIVVFSTTSSNNLVINTETLEYLDGVYKDATTQQTVTVDDAMLVKKYHTYELTDSATGYPCFTNGTDYQIECNFSVNLLYDVDYTTSFDLKFEVSKASDVPDGINGIDYLHFGEYPQTKLTDTTIINRLQDTGEDFTSYSVSAETYESLGMSGVTDAGSHDIYLDNTTGDRYVKIANPIAYDIEDDMQYNTGVSEYYKMEPLRWNILQHENGEALLMCAIGVEQVCFRQNTDMSGIVLDDKDKAIGSVIYENNYKYSDLRSFLTTTFFTQAFGQYQQNLILDTEVDNSISSAVYTYDKYCCANTTDKVFALSYAELTNSAYGFSEDSSEFDILRNARVSDYAVGAGARVMSAEAWIALLKAFNPQLEISNAEDFKQLFILTGEATENNIDYVYNYYVSLSYRWWFRSPTEFASSVKMGEPTGFNTMGHVNEVDSSCVPALRISL